MRFMKQAAHANTACRIRIGVGGWTFAPWRGSFYPEGLAQSQELHHASRQLTAIEVNGTFYSTMKPATFAKWRAETPGDFVFSLKASRYATHRKRLASAGESIERFVKSGISELGAKLGPIVWQLMPTKTFDAEDIAAFFALLPDAVEGAPLRHVLDVRHPSFACDEYVDLARRHKVATVFTDSDKFPSFADLTGDFVYARLMNASARFKAGYAPKAIGEWAARAAAWASGSAPGDLPTVQKQPIVDSRAPREVFIFFINGDKQKAPAAAQALIARLTR